MLQNLSGIGVDSLPTRRTRLPFRSSARGPPICQAPGMTDVRRIEAARALLSSRVPGEPLRAGTVAMRRGIVSRRAPVQLDPCDLLVAQALAVDRTTQRPRVFSHHTAAALWGLPIIGRWPVLVEYVSHQDDKGRSPGVRRRRTERPVEPQELGGLWVTTVARTVIDLAREDTLPSALASADHALRHGWCTLDGLRREAAAIPSGHRGRLRIPRPLLQIVRTAERDRADYFWPALSLCGEFDGKLKYGLLPGQSGRAAAEALFQEKRREDRIRAVGDTVGRWVWDEAYDLGRFEPVVRRLGLIPGTGISDWPSLSGPGKH